MRNMLRFLKGYEKESILAPLFKMLEACFELLVPLVVANIIDVGIKNGDLAYIGKQCGLMVLLAVVLGHCYSPLSSVTKTARPHRDSWSSAQRLDPRAPGTPGAVPLCAPQADTAPGGHFLILLILLYSQNVPSSTLLGKKCGGSQSISAKITAQRHP